MATSGDLPEMIDSISAFTAPAFSWEAGMTLILTRTPLSGVQSVSASSLISVAHSVPRAIQTLMLRWALIAALLSILS